MMKNKITVSRLAISFSIVILMTYLLPYRSNDGFETQFGYPIPFISVYDVPIARTPFLSMSVSLLALLLDMAVVYGILYLLSYGKKWITKNK